MGCFIRGKNYLWPDAIVPYSIKPGEFNHAQEGVIKLAIRHWNELTPITLVEREGEHDYVEFACSNDSCQSQVGRIGGRQEILCDIGRVFSTSSVIHEIGHTVGMWHEHSLSDRDCFVSVNYDNIRETSRDLTHNFRKHVEDGEIIGDYDYQSIMHYPQWAFAQPGTETISSPFLEDSAFVFLFNRQGLSKGDIDAVAIAYDRSPPPGNPRTDSQLNVRFNAILADGCHRIVKGRVFTDRITVTTMPGFGTQIHEFSVRDIYSWEDGRYYSPFTFSEFAEISIEPSVLTVHPNRSNIVEVRIQTSGKIRKGRYHIFVAIKQERPGREIVLHKRIGMQIVGIEDDIY